MAHGPIRVAADVGGTFTDILVRLPDGSLAVHKVLSTPPSYDRAVVGGVRELVERSGVHQGAVEEVVHGTTVATNAVLEHRGARTALVTTRGFRDVLELRRMRMPHLYDPFWTKPPPLVERRLRFEVDERVTASGEVLRALDPGQVRALAARLRRLGVESVAVCLLHGHRHPAHEQELGCLLREELPDVPVSLSSEILREQQEYERTAATVVNAYVRPLMERYIDDIHGGLDDLGVAGPLTIMQSSGGVMTSAAAATRPVFALESGPAAGVVAALGLARSLGIANVIAFDMGGTTAKASLIEGGRISRSREYEVGASLSAGSRLLRGSGELIRIPTIDIAEVGAGGGSIAWLDTGGGLRVGPRSAGADPGPACYGRGGDHATVTDANVVLGYIPTGRLASGDLAVSHELASQALATVADGLGLSVLEVARGVHDLASATMMRALRAVSSEKGRDPKEFALVAYGGSGPVHAAGLAVELGVQTVIVPPHAGLFSAAGLLFARSEFHDVRFCEVDARTPDLSVLAGLEAEMRSGLEEAIAAAQAVEWVRSADLRYAGQNWDIEIDFPAGETGEAAVAALVARFEQEHERVYGVRPDEEAPVEIRALRLAVLGPPPGEGDVRVAAGGASSRAAASRKADFGPAHGTVETPVLSRDDVPADGMDGPVLFDEYDTTVVVPPRWRVERHPDGALVLSGPSRTDEAPSTPGAEGADAILQEIVGNAFASVADEMATTVFRTAHSTVVRDVMDFSAALCGPTGETIAQAVTIPLHLGSIPTAMRSLIGRYGGAMEPGDVFIMNDPFDGGMHTPDIFVVKPVFHGERRTLVGYAVTVAHHGDVGGRLPGSSATDNTEVFQEGLRLPWMHLHRGNQPVDDLVRIIRANVRIPRMTMGDINAQVAACTIAERALLELADRYGAERLTRLMRQVVERTERIVRAEIASWPDGSASFVDYVGSDGIEVRDVRIAVDVTISGDEVTVDFSGSDTMVAGALNSTRSFAEATVFQAVMSAVSVDIPTSSGAFKPVSVVTKPGTVTHVVMPGASTMRGVTGFRMFDAVNGALAQLVPDRVAAAGEGGNTLAIFAGTRPDGERYIYFELVVGTWGARPGLDGNDGLSNPCATAANIPVELAEAEFPIMIERYGLVPDSGGPGRFRGGLAIERVWRTVLPHTSLQVRSDRQVHPPYGLAGGGPGGTSANTLRNGGGDDHPYPPMFSTVLEHPATFEHRMAGGGGWGDPVDREVDAVARDVLDEKVSVARARDDYGVVVDADGVVDEPATAALRARRRSER
jgi:N-methylhydantoinase A/oxoprolinase/acetone carboxylase beta subunit/N-methylhydantoinase B/oxoprolinase/acetone carboxylase alpha subunit